jgi:hypothetical protein
MLARGMWRKRSCVALLALAGCGSQTANPPPAEPPRSPPLTAAPAGEILAGVTRPVPAARTRAAVDRRARELVLGSARAPAGVGPTNVACAAWCYVTDTRGDALLVFRRLELVRRLYLAGGPYGIAVDRRRRLLYVTLPARNELVQLPAHGRPHVLRRWPTVRQPNAVAVDQASGVVTVTGESAVARVLPTAPLTRRTAPR